MTEFYRDDWLTIYQGDVRAVLPEIASDSVDCIVTSPPYWGLRDYGTASWMGGSEACDHRPNVTERALRPSNGLTGGKSHVDAGTLTRHVCGTCGATRQDSQLGLERTPEEYVANLVGVFREVRRVLKPSGTCWLNLGDSYANDGKWGGSTGGKHVAELHTGRSVTKGGLGRDKRLTGLKPKDLVGIPWRVAFALQADGWYLRSDIIWSKPNPMPESVTDRPTKAHEYLFLLTKAARYYYDTEAVREAASEASMARIQQPNFENQTGGPKDYANGVNPNRSARKALENFAANPGRNLRSVWTIATKPYPGAHFAVFPPELPERCIKAGSPHDGVVLDPFAGSGTTGMVANRLSRRAILIDLNGDYLKQQLKRNAQTPLGLAG